MFKSKGNLYFLFLVVLIIWGVVIYKVVGVFEDEPEAIPVVRTGREKEPRRVTKDTFSLLPLDHDPFLGHYYKKPEKGKKIKALPVKEVQWPEIAYLGLISGRGNSSGIHIVQINGKQILLEKGSAAEGVELLNSANGKVTLLYQGNRKTFFKS